MASPSAGSFHPARPPNGSQSMRAPTTPSSAPPARTPAAPSTVTALSSAFALAAVLLLTACGGGGGTKDTTSDGIQGAQGTASPSASASAGGAHRPSLAFPAGANNVFEDQQTGDPKKDAVLADSADGVNSVDQAILSGNAKAPALAFYETGNARASAAGYINGYLSKHLTWTGTTRYFDRTATVNADGTASVVYCSDESRSFLKNRKTGKVDHSPTTSQSYVLYNTRLKKNAKGVWQTTDVVSQRGAKQCQP